jgi:Polyketide cyclase / dehydrase and lipid transport
MPEQRRRRRVNKRAPSGDGDGTSDAVEQVQGSGGQAEGMAEQAEGRPEKADGQAAATGEQARAAGGTTHVGTLTAELTNVIRDAAIETLSPVARKATTSAAKYAVTKGPDLIGSTVMPKVTDAISEAGGPMELAKKAGGGAGGLLSKLGGGDGAGDADADATGSGRRMPVQQAVDVAVPLEVAYNQWTQFEEYPNFMHRVDSASQEDDANVTFTEKMWNFSRDFKAEIVEQRPNERIVWRSVNGLKHAGVVTFHRRAPASRSRGR